MKLVITLFKSIVASETSCPMVRDLVLEAKKLFF